jgi:hypothetical protein
MQSLAPRLDAHSCCIQSGYPGIAALAWTDHDTGRWMGSTARVNGNGQRHVLGQGHTRACSSARAAGSRPAVADEAARQELRHRARDHPGRGRSPETVDRSERAPVSILEHAITLRAHPWQQRFFWSKSRYVGIIAGIRGGKTGIGSLAFLRDLTACPEGWLFRPSCSRFEGYNQADWQRFDIGPCGVPGRPGTTDRGQPPGGLAPYRAGCPGPRHRDRARAGP